MKKNPEFIISDADRKLFAEMHRSFESVAEKEFFEKLCYKEQYESAYSNELLVYERENGDGIYLIRKYYDVYLVGYRSPEGNVGEYEDDTLAKVLFLRLDQCVGFPERVSLWEWLRRCDYSVVKYNRNYDND